MIVAVTINIEIKIINVKQAGKKMLTQKHHLYVLIINICTSI